MKTIYILFLLIPLIGFPKEAPEFPSIETALIVAKRVLVKHKIDPKKYICTRCAIKPAPAGHYSSAAVAKIYVFIPFTYGKND